MDNMVFTLEEGALMIEALEALKQFNIPEYLLSKTNALQNRIANGFPSFTRGELNNICIGLELLLEDDPMDWQANALLCRLRSSFDLPKQL